MTYKEPKHKQDTGVSFEASVFVWADEGGPMVPSSAGFHTPGPVECGSLRLVSMSPLPRAVEVKGYAKRLPAIFCHRIHWL